MMMVMMMIMIVTEYVMVFYLHMSIDVLVPVPGITLSLISLVYAGPGGCRPEEVPTKKVESRVPGKKGQKPPAQN